MTTYVLVHGAFTGGWAWREFAQLLRAKGHEVYAPTLTGLGERVHLATPETNLSTHVQDIVNVIEYEDLHDVVLAGHSYGGMVVTGVADRVPERVANLVAIDAIIPLDGQSTTDTTGGLLPAGSIRNGWRLLPPPPPADIDAVQAARLARWAPQPWATGEEKLRLSVSTEKQPFGRTFIRATGVPLPNIEPSAVRIEHDPAWRYFELPCGHGIYRDMPNELAAILLDLAT